VPALAEADTVTITSGEITLDALSGIAFSISLQGTDAVRSFSFEGRDFENTSASPFINDGVLHVGVIRRPHGPVMYGNQTYPVSDSGDVEISGFMILVLEGSAPFSAPELHTFYTALVPFTMVGTVRSPRQGAWPPRRI
jgi:hypothetical protein